MPSSSAEKIASKGVVSRVAESNAVPSALNDSSRPSSVLSRFKEVPIGVQPPPAAGGRVQSAAPNTPESTFVSVNLTSGSPATVKTSDTGPAAKGRDGSVTSLPTSAANAPVLVGPIAVAGDEAIVGDGSASEGCPMLSAPASAPEGTLTLAEKDAWAIPAVPMVESTSW